jgi:hypothetical protein
MLKLLCIVLNFKLWMWYRNGMNRLVTWKLWCSEIELAGGVAGKLFTCIRKVVISNLGRDTRWSEVFLWFSSVPVGNFLVVIRLGHYRILKSFLIQQSAFDAI